MTSIDQSLTQLLEHRIPLKTRIRGARIKSEGQVDLVELGPKLVTAMVLEEEPYDVTIRPTGDDLTLGCTCPAFAKLGPCKHLWAVALEVSEEVEHSAWSKSVLGLGGRGGSKVIDRLRGLERHVREEPDPWGGSGVDDQQLRYVIDLRQTRYYEGLALEFRVAKRLEDGSFGDDAPVNPYGSAPIENETDRRLLALLAGTDGAGDPLSSGSATPILTHALSELVLPELAATGRLHWKLDDEQGGPLRLDTAEPFVVRVAIEAEGNRRRLDCWFERNGGRIDASTPTALFPYGWMIVGDVLTRLDGRGALALVEEVRAAGVLEFGADELAGVLAAVTAMPGLDGALAEDLGPVEDVVPEAVLKVETGGRRERRVLGCTVAFDYDDTRVESGDARGVVPVRRGQALARRNHDLERAAVERFFEVGGRRGAAASWHEGPGAVDAARFGAMTRTLLAEGWKIEADDLRLRIPGAASVSVASGIDWFELQGAVPFGDQTASLPELLAAARAGRDTVQLGDGSVGMLPEDWLARWNFLSLGEVDGERLRFRNSQASLIDALLSQREGQLEHQVDKGFQKLRAGLEGFERVEPANEPRGFRGELRPYQREGLGWLRFLERLGVGGCLADDMGLGKTVQLLAYLQGRKLARGSRKEAHRPSLVVAPRSLVFNWIDEAERFTPGLKVLDYTGPGRKRLRKQLGEVDLFVTTYGTLRSDAEYLSQMELDCAVLDEAQAIKNASSLTAKAARLLQARRRIALSGTPIENHLGELWSLFEFLNPGMLGSAGVFARLVSAKPIPAGAPDSEAPGGEALDGLAADDAEAPAQAEPPQTSPELDTETLARAMRPFFLRRRKSEVLDDLPPKTEQTLHCKLGPTERKRYDDLRRHFRESLLAREQEVGFSRMKIHVLEALLRLRQAALHPALLDPAHADEPSAKLDLLLPLLEELAEEGQKALVFSQFTKLLGVVRARLDAAGVPYEYLDGRTRNRKERVQRFQSDPDVPLFLISLKAGGHGLNLTAADCVFLLDPWWNPAVEAQAVDRAHRIGRERPVMAYRLIAENTIEERVLELQDRKRALAKALFDESAANLKGLTRDDLEALFAD